MAKEDELLKLPDIELPDIKKMRQLIEDLDEKARLLRRMLRITLKLQGIAERNRARGKTRPTPTPGG